VFTLNVASQDVRPVLLIECPRMLFPFARQILASTTLNGGFLPLMLGPVDFAALYRKQQQDEEAADAQPAMIA
jgi:preprotein translocase subunit SecB